MAELVLVNNNIDFLRYVDYRKIIKLEAFNIFILHGETKKGSNIK